MIYHTIYICTLAHAGPFLVPGLGPGPKNAAGIRAGPRPTAIFGPGPGPGPQNGLVWPNV